MRLRLSAAIVLLATCHLTLAANVWIVEMDGAIGPASSDFFIRSLQRADEANVDLVIMRLDTPGGLDKSMRDMIKAILASRVPVATYVAPGGSRAASAGTYIMYASHIAAMAPATNIGSSTPVSIGGGGSPFPMPQAPKPPGTPDDGEQGSEEQEPAGGASGSTMERKGVNDAVAYIKSLAELRNRNVEWAEQTVRTAANLPASEALEQNVIDIIAPDIDSLLAQIDGRTLDVDGRDVTLSLADADIEHIVPDWRYELLGLITDPNVAYILLMIGVYGLILEFYNPGTGIAGVTGIICLLLGAYALQMLPINYAGLALMIVGIGLLVAEAFSPSFGVLGTGGLIAFIFGSIILMDTDLPAYQISLPIIVAFAAASAGLLIFTTGAAIKARNSAVVSGTEGMIGQQGVVIDSFEGSGHIRAFGEIWQASSATPLVRGNTVTITDVDGLTLGVEPSADGPSTAQSSPADQNEE